MKAPEGYTEDEYLELAVRGMQALLRMEERAYKLALVHLPANYHQSLDNLRERTAQGEDTADSVRQLLQRIDADNEAAAAELAQVHERMAAELAQFDERMASVVPVMGSNAVDCLEQALELWVQCLTPEHDLTPCIELLEQYAERLRNGAAGPAKENRS